ncbi:MAG TPA: DUF2892 domain-containing protein [Firmicutes bacterium]|nr:DUF2892 domain-containing protein [Bacillota bacterium]
MQNVGAYDATLRIAAGAFILTWAGRKTRWTAGTTLLAMTGAITLAEGMTRTCLLHNILGITTADDANEKVLLRLGPLVYRRNKGNKRRLLWGVDTAQEDEELSYRNADTVEPHGWR